MTRCSKTNRFLIIVLAECAHLLCVCKVSCAPPGVLHKLAKGNVWFYMQNLEVLISNFFLYQRKALCSSRTAILFERSSLCSFKTAIPFERSSLCSSRTAILFERSSLCISKTAILLERSFKKLVIKCSE